MTMALQYEGLTPVLVRARIKSGNTGEHPPRLLELLANKKRVRQTRVDKEVLLGNATGYAVGAAEA